MSAFKPAFTPAVKAGWTPVWGAIQDLVNQIKNVFASGGNTGAWYSPNRAISAPWYQDSIGTTPVTAVEQPVGLALDWSLGAVLGPDLAAASGSFTNGQGAWTESAGGTWTFTGGFAAHISTQVASNIRLNVLTVGKYYELQLTVVSLTVGSVRPFIGLGTPTALLTAPGTYTVRGFCATNGIIYLDVPANSDVVVDNVSVKLLDGNHATQPTAASRPVLSSRVNLLTKTELISDVAWSKTAATTGSSTADENGNLTLIPVSNSPGINSYIAQTVPIPNNCVVVRTVTAKKITGANQIAFEFNDGVTGGNAAFDLISGSAVATAGVASIVNLGNGFWECTHAFTTATTGTPSANVIYIGVYGPTAIPTTIAVGKTQVSLGSKQRYQRVSSVNLLTKTEDFTDAAWVGYYVKPPITNGVLAPDGTFTAAQFGSADYSSPSPYSGILQSGAIAANSGNVTVSVWARCVTGTLLLRLGIDDNYGVNNTLTTTWQRLTVTFNVTTAPVNGRLLQIFESTLSNQAWQIWHPQCEFNATATPYQKVDTPATDYDTVGFPSYLKFDGTQTSLSSATGGGGSAGFFFCAAITVAAGGASYKTIYSDHSNGTGYTLRVEFNNSLTLYAGNGISGFTACSGAIVIAGVKCLVTGYDDGVNLGVQVNNGPLTLVTRPVVVAGLSNFSLGKYVGGEIEFFNGQIYESVYVRNTGLTPDQRLQIQRQVAAAAGITL